MGASVLFNASVRLKGLPGNTPPPGPGTGTNIRRDYADGFVGVDSTGNAGDVTSFWRYENASQYDPAGAGGDGSIALSHIGMTALPAVSAEDDPYTGIELNYSRDLYKFKYGIIGVEAAVNWVPMKISGNRVGSSGSVTTTDFYGLGGAAPLPPGETGPFDRGGGGMGGGSPLLDAQPYDRVVTPSSVDFNFDDNIDLDFYGFRFGPFYQAVLGKWSFQGNVGLSVAYVDVEFRHTETFDSGSGPTSTTAKSNGSETLIGGYAGGGLAYAMTDRWSLFANLNYHMLSDFSETAGDQKARFQFSRLMSLSAGVNFSF